MKNLTRFVAGSIFLVPMHFAMAQQAERDELLSLLNSVELYADAPGSDARIVVRTFDASEADLGTGAEGGKRKQVEAAQEMQRDAPGLLAEAIVEELKALDYFADVRLDTGDAGQADTVVIDGRFTKLNPGSRAKRYFGGFGAGREAMEVEGTVRDASGAMLAKFRQERISVMGVGGGDYQKKMASGMERIGQDIAVFLHAWSAGE
jgi:hypothetical protein